MKTVEEVKELLLKNFNSVYCDTCSSEFCEGCNRKEMNWGISESYAQSLAEFICNDNNKTKKKEKEKLIEKDDSGTFTVCFLKKKYTNIGAFIQKNKEIKYYFRGCLWNVNSEIKIEELLELKEFCENFKKEQGYEQ